MFAPELFSLVPDVVVHANTLVGSAMRGAAHASEQATAMLVADGIDVKPVQPPGGEKILRLLGWLKWAVYIIGVGALIGAGAIFALEKYQQRGDSKAAQICLYVIIGAVVSVSAVGIIDAATS
ncbi:hypothetical protein [Tsukamurella spumae]|uniref:Uncharacterized protein n=1 Tax=Tsukamurella spumae TaxID=44753 RepID=A0A846X1M9_9ACTN|nr:hypothetical protein [Tsukamurella spumae]NKY19497.1 hypothetical protein [Tsukamurella spumae]